MNLITYCNIARTLKLSTTALFLFLVSCANTSGINVIDKSTINGTLTGYSSSQIHPDTKLHLLIRQSNSLNMEGGIIAEKTLTIDKAAANFPYSIEVPTKSILPEEKYTIEACITIAGKLHWGSNENSQVLNGEQIEIDEITLTPLKPFSERSGLNSWLSENKSTLHNSIQSTLSGTCQNFSSNYDKLNNVKASSILPKHLLSSQYHQVEELVSLRGAQYLFSVTSDFGEFYVQGIPMLRRTIQEIYAINIINQIEKSDEFSKAFSDESLAPFGELKALILNPIERLSGAVKGVGTFIKSSSASLTQKRSHYEDRYLEALLSVSKYKRQFAQQLKVDAYTSNAELQKRLNRISWAAALGSWVPSILLMPISGPTKLVYSSLNLEETLNQLITEESPDSLRFSNKKTLQSFGVSNEAINHFLSHKYYTPRHHTIIVNAFKSMEQVQGIESFINEAVTAQTDASALVFQQLAEFIVKYHQTQEAISKIKVYMGIPFGITKTGNWIMLLPIDIGRWSHFAEFIFKGFNELKSDDLNSQKHLWISGKTTLLFRQNIKGMGITLEERAHTKLLLLD